VLNKRSSTNIPATLNSTGLLDTENWRLTDEGVRIANASSTFKAAKIFAKSMLVDKNGMALIDAIRSLNLRGENVSKASLKKELVAHGVEDKTFRNAYNASFQVDTKFRQAKTMAQRYGVTGVPALIINGKYKTTGPVAGSHEKMIEVLNRLIKQESQAK
jgi:predicted DsbA family dithiol-disulfide isomerase